MALNTEALKAKLAKALEIAPNTAVVYRRGKNQFGEPEGQETVCEIRGLYYAGGYFKGKNAYAKVSVKDGGRTLNAHAEKFLAVADENARKIQVGDCLAWDGQRFEITDLGVGLEVYFDLSLERL